MKEFKIYQKIKIILVVLQKLEYMPYFNEFIIYKKKANFYLPKYLSLTFNVNEILNLRRNVVSVNRADLLYIYSGLRFEA